jgi:hypothetical protein
VPCNQLRIFHTPVHKHVCWKKTEQCIVKKTTTHKRVLHMCCAELCSAPQLLLQL